MTSKQLNVMFGVIVVVLLGVVGYLALRDNSQNETLGQKNTIPDSNLATNATPPPSVPKDETANWKTYENDTTGASFKYPSDWVISSGEGAEIFMASASQKLLDDNAKNCADNNLQTQCRSELIVEQVSFSIIQGKTDFGTMKGAKIVSGVTFTQYVSGGLGGNYTTYVTTKDGVHFIFTAHENSLARMEQIVSTFKFTR